MGRTGKYKIRDDDGEIYSFKNTEEVLEALAKALGHEYYWNGEWFQR